MARRRRVSYRGKDGIVSFLYKNSKQEKEIKAQRARLKREIVNEIVKEIEDERAEGCFDEELVRKAARLAIELWEKRR